MANTQSVFEKAIDFTLWSVIGIFLAGVFALVIVWGTCEILFTKTVAFERDGWRYEAKVEGLMGISIRYSSLSYNGTTVPVGALRNQFFLLTPIGEFSSAGGRWSPTYSDIPWWSDKYQLPAKTPGKAWVRQVDQIHPIRDYVEDFVSQGYYSAPPLGADNTPWTARQFKETPIDWVYLYRLREGHVKGYWTDPDQLQDFLSD